MIEWTRAAIEQLDQAHDYIAMRNSDTVASRIMSRVLTTVQQLAHFPASGRPGRVSGTRELVIPNTPLIAAYKAEKDKIVVLATYHGASAGRRSYNRIT